MHFTFIVDKYRERARELREKARDKKEQYKEKAREKKEIYKEKARAKKDQYKQSARNAKTKVIEVQDRYKETRTYDLTCNILAGTFTASIAVMILNPVDCLKIRWQVSDRAETGNSMRRFAWQIVKKEGMWKGLARTAILTNGLSIGLATGIRMALYPHFRNALAGNGEKKTHHMMLGGLCGGAVSYWLTTPLAQAKTRIQAEAGEVGADGILISGKRAGQKPQYKNGIDFMKQELAKNGVKGLFRGAVPSVVRGALLASGQFVGYDTTKTQAKAMGYGDHPAVHVFGSFIGALIGVTMATPADFIMTRYMTAKETGRPYRGIFDCFVTESKKAGPIGLMRGWLPFFTRICPIFIMYLPAYEWIRCNVFKLGFFE